MLSAHLNYQHINTGAMYRAVTLHAIRNEWIIDSIGVESVQGSNLTSLNNLEFDFIYNKNQSYQIHLNKENVEKQIKEPLVAKYVSFDDSVFPELRKKIVLIQQEMGRNRGVVMEGRDIGSVVFPSAELKLFITASLEIRAQRRYKELLNMGVKTDFVKVLENLEMRDFQDSNRKKSPLIQVKDAILIDNTTLSLMDQFDFILNLLKNKFNICKKSILLFYISNKYVYLLPSKVFRVRFQD